VPGRAGAADVPAIVGLLADDALGAGRDGVRTAADLSVYQRAFELIDSDPAHVLVVAEAGGAVAGTMQLSFLPGLARRGALRAQIEAVRVAAAARRRGCGLVQLTTDKSRGDAQRFYAELGFVATHEGLKLVL
jgi:acetyltransferase (GNAT) family protein